jgi:hypothetical protein
VQVAVEVSAHLIEILYDQLGVEKVLDREYLVQAMVVVKP